MYTQLQMRSASQGRLTAGPRVTRQPRQHSSCTAHERTGLIEARAPVECVKQEPERGCLVQRPLPVHVHPCS